MGCLRLAPTEEKSTVLRCIWRRGDSTKSGVDRYDYGARFYDPAVARFHTIDPLAETYNYQSPFAYAANNPIRYIDWMGMGPGGPPLKLMNKIPRIGSGDVTAFLHNSVANAWNGLANTVNYVYSSFTDPENTPTLTDVAISTVDTISNFNVKDLRDPDVQEQVGGIIIGAALSSGAAKLFKAPNVGAIDDAAITPSKGAADPLVAESIRAGKKAHNDLTIRAGAKGWETNVRMIDPKTNKPVVADVVTKGGHPLELKPDTPSGAAKGATQLPQYERPTGNKGRVIFYDPDKYRNK